MVSLAVDTVLHLVGPAMVADQADTEVEQVELQLLPSRQPIKLKRLRTLRLELLLKLLNKLLLSWPHRLLKLLNKHRLL